MALAERLKVSQKADEADLGNGVVRFSRRTLRESIFMMQAAEDRLGHHPAITRNSLPSRPCAWQIHGRIWNPRAQTRVRSAPVVVNHPFPEKTSQMPLIQRDDEIQTFPADGAYQPFAICICDRRPHRRLQDLQARRFDGQV
jgi:hypothetical protein